METNLAPKPEKQIAADAWIEAPKLMDYQLNQEGRIAHEDLDRLTAEYLRSGGKIEEVETGKTGWAPPAAALTISPAKSKFTEDERREYEERRRSKVTDDDEKFVEIIRANAPAVKSSAELAKRCGISQSKCQRILRTHLMDDPVASLLIAVPQWVRQRVRDLYPKLIKHMSREECAAQIGIAADAMDRLVAQLFRKRAKD
jgi:hypothetical protein